MNDLALFFAVGSLVGYGIGAWVGKRFNDWEVCVFRSEMKRIEKKRKRLRDLWIKYLEANRLMTPSGVGFPEELSYALNISLPLAHEICDALEEE